MYGFGIHGLRVGIFELLSQSRLALGGVSQLGGCIADVIFGDFREFLLHRFIPSQLCLQKLEQLFGRVLRQLIELFGLLVVVQQRLGLLDRVRLTLGGIGLWLQLCAGLTCGGQVAWLGIGKRFLDPLEMLGDRL